MFVGMVVGGRGATCCHQAMGPRSCFDPCMPGLSGVGRLACDLFIIALLLLQQFGWCMVVLAASWSACSSLGPFCCCQRCRILGSIGSFV